MINRIWHIPNVASLRDAVSALVINPQTALRLSGGIKIKLLRSLSVVSNWPNYFDVYGNSRTFAF